jgi:phospholipid-translocating ATPase
MNSSHEYHKPIESSSPNDSASEDDLDLNELDPAGSSSHRPGNGSFAHGLSKSLRRYGPGIALQNLRSSSRIQLHKKATPDADEEDLEGLLGNGAGNSADGKERQSRSTQDEFWMPTSGRRGRRRAEQEQRAGPSTGLRERMSSFSSTLNLPEFVRQEIADMEDNVDINNQESREVNVGQMQKKKFPPNVVSNAKYTLWSFLPRTLYNEFSFFLNIYFLLVALSQIIPYLRIGYMSTYTVPLAVVLTISIGKEAVDDIARRRRDAEANAEYYTICSLNGPGDGSRSSPHTHSATPVSGQPIEIQKKSRDIKVGDILKLSKDQRLPADVVILKTVPNDVALTLSDPDASNSSASETHLPGETFIRTDQLDGETDWKLRITSPLSQFLGIQDFSRITITAGAPDKKVNDFVGTLKLQPKLVPSYDPHISKENSATPNGDGAEPTPVSDDTEERSAPLTIDNTAWANTVLASNTTTFAVVIYTGRQTRSALSTSASRSKTGLLEIEINTLTKILCALTLTLSIVLVALEGFEPTNKKPWYVAIMIYLILFSTIIPISLRVNLDMGKTVYAYFMEHDRDIPGTVVRTSTIPEDLGRIEYLLSDKTGTLTQNEMELRKIHVGTVSYANDAMEEVRSYIKQAFSSPAPNDSKTDTLITPSSAYVTHTTAGSTTRTRREVGSRVRDLVLALALCHNVTPTMEEVDGENIVTYQASSPDEIAIVRFTESVGLRLLHRDRESIVLESVETNQVVVRVKILDIFPFTSDSKRMGIIVSFSTNSTQPESSYEQETDCWFYQKGADTVMASIVSSNDWLDEETANMAREGLRTLVVGRRKLSAKQYQEFATSYNEASLALHNRDTGMAAVVKRHLEHDLELLGVTGVEDRLQRDVKPSLELLRNAGVKIWMLTGDKVETARCVAVSARLVARGQEIRTLAKLRHKTQAKEALDSLGSKTDACLLIDGETLALMLTHFRTQFISLAVLLPAVIACRCSPTQKAEVANLIRQHTRKRVCCIGDGGNDVSMIQAADVGIGIVGKEGRQASLAADFSITQFCHLTKLLVWHGRNSYKRSAKLAQFVIHRGLIISVCQTMYSIAGHFDPKGLFKDWLLVGYATVYTMAPVFSLVLDRDVDENMANLYPELYKELKTGKSLSYRTFFTWVMVSIYQGVIIQGLSQLLVRAVDGPHMLSVSFTVLVLNELIMVAVAVTTWHPIMILSIVGTGALYAGSVPFLGDYFDLGYIVSWGWVWRVAAVAAISLVPVWGGKVIRRAWKPPSYRKVRGI